MNTLVDAAIAKAPATVDTRPGAFPSVLRKDLRLVHFESDTRLSLVQRKLQTVLLTNAVHTGIEHQYHVIRTKTAAEQIGWEQSRDRKSLFESLQKLGKIQFIFARLGLTDEQVSLAKGRKVGKGLGFSQFLAEVWFETEPETGHSIIRYMLGPAVKEYLTQTLQYDIYDLATIARISTEPALALYENFYHYRHMGETEWIPIPTLQALLGTVHSKHYEDVRRLTQKVLTPATKVVSEESNITIEYATRRTDRKISDIKFIIREKSATTTTRQAEIPGFAAPSCFNGDLVREMVEFGVARSVAEQLAIDNPESVIVNAIQYTKKAKEAKEKKGEGEQINLGGYLVTAIKNKWGSETEAARAKREQRERKAALAKQAAAQAEEEKAQKEREQALQRQQSVANYLSSLSKDEVEEIKCQFIAKNKTICKLVGDLIKDNPDTWIYNDTRGLRSAFERFVASHIESSPQAALI